MVAEGVEVEDIEGIDGDGKNKNKLIGGHTVKKKRKKLYVI